MVDAKKWRELHMTQASRWEYGVWFPAAMATLEKQKEEVKNRSFQLGISLHFVFTELEAKSTTLGHKKGLMGPPPLGIA